MGDSQSGSCANEIARDERKPERKYTGCFVAGLVVAIVAVLFFGSIPFLAVNDGGSGVGSEGRAVLGAMKDRAQQIYKRTGKAPASLADLSLNPTELNGSYFTDANYSCGGNAKHWWAKCSGAYEKEPKDLVLTADLETGSASFNR